MRILLVGEYSNFHNSLKYGLEFLGHEVTIIGDGDGFKRFPVDINIGNDFLERSWFTRKLKVGLWKITGYHLADYLKLSRFRESEPLLKHYDIVQFINSNPFNCGARTERKMLESIIAQNKRFFLAACGDDHEYVKYLTEEHQGYSILEAVKHGKQQQTDFQYSYKYLKPAYRDNYYRLVDVATHVIPSNVDYAMALTHNPKAIPIIPAAINCGALHLDQNADLSVIKIFVGINRSNYWKKGINYFEETLEIIKKKYGSKVEVMTAENLPYNEYVKIYKKAHILLDQVLCYDQGYNALEAMLQGKVVFSGAGEVYLTAHQLTSVPAIDAQPDVDYLVGKLSELIDHPISILEIGRTARNHVLQHHESVMIAERYLQYYQE
ncbi:glycosyltransferase [Nonlabens agnitus]|uniref:Glycosyl transferase n=1 Tax=Nonlabens agnitus TaxID=870484 RepID=A0A2S9WUT4_9FLAO|nr:glycosyltransferase [Nonlabens agnitus]PRP67240.1 glycosyl transferase [Nonlabens agnitus]